MNDEFFTPLHDAGSAGRHIGSRVNFNDYNPLLRGYKIMPKTMVCKECGSVVSFSPFQVITYMNRKLVLEGYCDQCTYKKVQEGKEKLSVWLEKEGKKERDKQDAMTRRLLDQEEQEKKRKNAVKEKNYFKDNGDSASGGPQR